MGNRVREAGTETCMGERVSERRTRVGLGGEAEVRFDSSLSLSCGCVGQVDGAGTLKSLGQPQ